ncbi:hypothetical protein M438DRAFT_291442 [Aureobasidium pullulans EXF-150]|uniref:NAD(P)-binding protein n=1 Tax=Aureobasidium pullulans EXF-150 TaxID=1043002 RepID=A0A074XXX8_AURPU|nr:uncharacterized protein M438DRAFT_291442 [Aureobasidium pullulans EXF-150]KEQ86792.1 hypothetical protein M438DRAFT_291442 [Aureobasidium pullulans EXF-150]
MVALETIRASNSRIASTLPSGLVAIFVGATNGVGEATVRQFAKYASAPRVYLIGRSQDAGTRIVNECRALNAKGEFTFISKDTSLMRNVDEICDTIKHKEKSVNLLFLTIGTLQTGKTTVEGLHYPAAIAVHARNRFITNLLPLIKNATSLRRVISVFIATLEGEIQMDDFQGWHMKLMANRDHAASITTLSLESHHKDNPNVSFVHNFPGVIKSGITRGTSGVVLTALKAVVRIFGSLFYMPAEEAGDRHVFLSTSARYSAGEKDEAAGVPLSVAPDLSIARGTDGKLASGVYSINASGESAGEKVEDALASLRSRGMTGKVMDTINTDIEKALAANTKA